MVQRVSRRRLLRATAAAAVGLGGAGTVSAASGETGGRFDDLERIPLRDAGGVSFEQATAVPERAGGVRPGSQMFMEGGGDVIDRPGGCTANFVWRATGPGEAPQSSNADPPGHSNAPDGPLYLGAAGHCFLPDDVQASENAARRGEDSADVSDLEVWICDDCTFGGATTVFGVEGAGSYVGADDVHEVIELGEVVYARQEEPGGGSGVGHDFGLVEIPEDKHHLVDPSMPQWGGPSGVSPGPVPAGEPVHQYGAGVGNGEVFPTKGSSGVSFGGDDDAWYAGIRASPGDSGSPLIGNDAASGPPVGGPAAGILTHLSTGGTAGTTIGRCKEMVREDIGLEIEVVLP